MSFDKEEMKEKVENTLKATEDEETTWVSEDEMAEELRRLGFRVRNKTTLRLLCKRLVDTGKLEKKRVDGETFYASQV